MPTGVEEKLGTHTKNTAKRFVEENAFENDQKDICSIEMHANYSHTAFNVRIQRFGSMARVYVLLLASAIYSRNMVAGNALSTMINSVHRSVLVLI